MTQIDALRGLSEKVEAGTAPDYSMFIKGPQDWDAFDLETERANAGRAYRGSLDAAKALHDAVLPGWFSSCGSWGACVSDPETHVSDSHSSDEEGPSYARAWLLAIIRAKIAELEA